MPYSDSHGRVINVGCVLRASNQLWPSSCDTESSWANATSGSTHPEDEQTHATKNTTINILQGKESITPGFDFN
jgi:hypothetical protein